MYFTKYKPDDPITVPTGAENEVVIVSEVQLNGTGYILVSAYSDQPVTLVVRQIKSGSDWHTKTELTIAASTTSEDHAKLVRNLGEEVEIAVVNTSGSVANVSPRVTWELSQC